MTAFNPGDPVHVSFDGVVTKTGADGSTWVLDGDWSYFVRPEHLSPVPTPVLFADIRKGDQIRAENGDSTTVFEFTVKAASPVWVTGDCVAFDASTAWQFFRLTPPVPPEPEYEVGAVYQDASEPKGVSYLRTRHGGWADFNGTEWGHGKPARPLVRLVPEEPK